MQKEYAVNGVRLDEIRNKNEIRIVRLLPEVLAEFADYRPDYLAIQDIYALALNRLPPRYTQKTTFVVNEPLEDEEIRDELRRAVEQVETHPKGR